MSWADYKVGGSAVGLWPHVDFITTAPILRGPDGRRFVLRDLDAEEPKLNLPIYEQEFADNVRLGVFVELPSWEAKRQHLVMAAADVLWASLAEHGIEKPTVAETTTEDGWQLLYVHREISRAFRQRATSVLLARARLLRRKDEARWASQIALDGTKEREEALSFWTDLTLTSDELPCQISPRAQKRP